MVYVTYFLFYYRTGCVIPGQSQPCQHWYDPFNGPRETSTMIVTREINSRTPQLWTPHDLIGVKIQNLISGWSDQQERAHYEMKAMC